MEAGGPIWIKEAGFGDEDGLGIKDRGLEEVTQGSDCLWMGLDGQAMDGEL